MSEYDNTNSGALFKNEKKEQDTHSDYNGNINVNGQEFWLNAWLKKSKAGKTYMSLSVKPKEAKPQATAPNDFPDDSIDDLPF